MRRVKSSRLIAVSRFVAEFPAQQHFSISMLEHAEDGKPSVTANSGSVVHTCHEVSGVGLGS